MTTREPERRMRKIRRKRKDGGPRVMYFNSDTHAAIVEHQNATNDAEKHRVYTERIHPAFDKLVENLINIHRFASASDSHDDVKNDCITFLYESMHKFDNSRGTNAFSYFNIVAKHWLIIRSKKRASRQKRNVSMSDSEELTNFDMNAIEEYSMVPSQDEIMHKIDMKKNVIAVLQQIKDRVKTKNENVCIDSIITLFESADSIDLLNKSAVLVYIREMSGLSPKQLTMTMYSIKRYYRELRDDDNFNIFM